MAFDATKFYGWPAGSITRLPSISGWIHPVCALRHKPPGAERPPHVWMAPVLQELFRDEQWSLAVMCPAFVRGVVPNRWP